MASKGCLSQKKCNVIILFQKLPKIAKEDALLEFKYFEENFNDLFSLNHNKSNKPWLV
jgi:hypothetical protein